MSNRSLKTPIKLLIAAVAIVSALAGIALVLMGLDRLVTGDPIAAAAYLGVGFVGVIVVYRMARRAEMVVDGW